MPATTLGSAPSMPATTIMTRADFEPIALREHAVDAGDADVVDAIDRVAHKLGRDRRFFGDRQSDGAGRTQHDRSLPGVDVAFT